MNDVGAIKLEQPRQKNSDSDKDSNIGVGRLRTHSSDQEDKVMVIVFEKLYQALLSSIRLSGVFTKDSR